MTSLKYCCSSSLVKLMKSCLELKRITSLGSSTLNINRWGKMSRNVKKAWFEWIPLWKWQPDVRWFSHQISSQSDKPSSYFFHCPATPRSFDQRTRNQKCRELQPQRRITRSVSMPTVQNWWSTHPKKGGQDMATTTIVTLVFGETLVHKHYDSLKLINAL